MKYQRGNTSECQYLHTFHFSSSNDTSKQAGKTTKKLKSTLTSVLPKDTPENTLDCKRNGKHGFPLQITPQSTLKLLTI